MDVERAVLGAVLVNPDLLDGVAATLRPGDFSREAHRRIAESMWALNDRGVVVDAVTVAHELESQGALEAAGGAAYLGGLLDGVPRVQGAGTWAQLVLDASRRRSLRAIGEALVRDASDESVTVGESMERLRVRSEKLLRNSGEMVGMAQVVDESVEYLHHRGVTGRAVSWGGLADLDRMTSGGLHGGELAFVGARTSIGKSVLAGQVALSAARSGRRVAFFTLEMSREQMGARFLLSEGNARAWTLAAGGDVGKDGWARVDRAAVELRRLPILWDHSSTLTVAHIRAKCRAAAADGALGLVVVDYFQRIAVEGKADRWVGLGNVARGLKSLARELGVPVLVPAQLNREAEGRRPCLADLRECGDIEQEADVVVLLHRDREDRNAVVPTDAILAKNRQGEVGSAVVGFKTDAFRFVNHAGDER